MLYIKPDYYDDFKCIADQCEDTCCAGWQIVVDDDALKRYHAQRGPFRHTLHKNINWRKKIFRQDRQKRCAFLNEDNLCDMYSALGESSLCLTCQRYPRHIEEFEGVRETSLSISCPTVARYLMERKEPVRFLYVDTDEEEDCPDFAKMDFDVLLYDILEEGRKHIISIFQERSLPFRLRCERAIHLAADMEQYIDDGNAFFCYELFEKYEDHTETFQRHRLKKSMLFSSRVIGSMFRLERLREDWEMLLSESAAVLFLDGEAAYESENSEFINWQRAHDNFMLIPLEQLAVYYSSTYFCGSVYDGKILSKVQSALLFLYVIWELSKARWLKNGKFLDLDDLYEIVYRFSRELEHSDKNLDRMERIAQAALPVLSGNIRWKKRK